MIRMLLDIFIYQQNRLSWPLHRLNIFQMKFCIGGVDCQPYHEILYQKYIFLPIMLMMTKTQKICARDANIACITTTEFFVVFLQVDHNK